MKLPSVTMGDCRITSRSTMFDSVNNQEIVGKGWNIQRPVYINEVQSGEINYQLSWNDVHHAFLAPKDLNSNSKILFELWITCGKSKKRLLDFWIAPNPDNLPRKHQSTSGYTNLKPLDDDSLIEWLKKREKNDRELITAVTLTANSVFHRIYFKKTLARLNKHMRKLVENYKSYRILLKQGFKCHASGCNEEILAGNPKTVKITPSIKRIYDTPIYNLKTLCRDCYMKKWRGVFISVFSALLVALILYLFGMIGNVILFLQG